MKTSTTTVRECLDLSRAPDPKKIEIGLKIAELSNFKFDDGNLCWSLLNDKMASENQTLCLAKVSNECFFLSYCAWGNDSSTTEFFFGKRSSRANVC
jgi:hypothetical protein